MCFHLPGSAKMTSFISGQLPRDLKQKKGQEGTKKF